MIMEKEIPFFTPVWKFNIGVDFAEDIALCYQTQNEIPSVKISNMGGYQSFKIDLKVKFPSLFERVLPKLNDVLQDSKLNVSVRSAWVNINKTHNSNVSHFHANSALSGVIYLQTSPNSGNIVFENPTASPAFPITETVKGFFGVYFVSPQVGDVLVFPSYLRHYVESNLSDKDRISIAFNMA